MLAYSSFSCCLIWCLQQTMNGGEVIVMELCPNGSLYNVLDSPENSYGLCEEEFLLVLKQVCKYTQSCPPGPQTSV